MPRRTWAILGRPRRWWTAEASEQQMERRAAPGMSTGTPMDTRVQRGDTGAARAVDRDQSSVLQRRGGLQATS